MHIGKYLIIVGLIISAAGVLLLTGAHLPESIRLFRLPGDIHIEHNGNHIFIPITTMVLLSAIGTTLMWFIRS